MLSGNTGKVLLQDVNTREHTPLQLPRYGIGQALKAKLKNVIRVDHPIRDEASVNPRRLLRLGITPPPRLIARLRGEAGLRLIIPPFCHPVNKTLNFYHIARKEKELKDIAFH